jgi:hypothetical protein
MKILNMLNAENIHSWDATTEMKWQKVRIDI